MSTPNEPNKPLNKEYFEELEKKLQQLLAERRMLEKQASKEKAPEMQPVEKSQSAVAVTASSPSVATTSQPAQVVNKQQKAKETTSAIVQPKSEKTGNPFMQDLKSVFEEFENDLKGVGFLMADSLLGRGLKAIGKAFTERGRSKVSEKTAELSEKTADRSLPTASETELGQKLSAASKTIGQRQMHETRSTPPLKETSNDNPTLYGLVLKKLQEKALMAEIAKKTVKKSEIEPKKPGSKPE